MDITKLFNWSYLFSAYAPAGFSWTLRIVLGVLFVGAIVLAVIAMKKIKKTVGPNKVVWKKLTVWGWTIGLIGLLLMFFREVRTLYLGARLWLLLLLLLGLVWLIFILIYRVKVLPRQEKIRQETEEFNRWLPKSKK